MKKALLLTSGIITLFTSCQSSGENNYDSNGIDSIALSAIDEESLVKNITTLSSDSFMGRKPFTKGDTLAVEYIENQFKELGLSPANGDSYFQEVPMVSVSSIPTNDELVFKGKSGDLSVKYLDDYVIGSKRTQKNITIDDAELVFVGFGNVAPEFKWNDYKDVDVKGKTVVAIVSDTGRYEQNLSKEVTTTYNGS